jgi:hypothetical protein
MIRIERDGAVCEPCIGFNAIKCNAMTTFDTSAALYTTVVEIAHAMRREKLPL